MVLVFDYDGTIVKNSWPGVGEFRWLARPILRWLKKIGVTLILFTCREDRSEKGTIYENGLVQSAEHIMIEI